MRSVWKGILVVALMSFSAAVEADPVGKAWQSNRQALGIAHWVGVDAQGGESHLMCIDGEDGVAYWQVIGGEQYVVVTLDPAGCASPPTWFEEARVEPR